MGNKFLSLMDTTKEKVSVALLCGAIVASTLAGTVYASGTKPTGDTVGKDDKTSFMKTLTKDVEGKDMFFKINDANGKNLQVKIQEGVNSFSTDGGKNWSKDAPAGFITGLDGKNAFMKDSPKDATEKRLMVKRENGVRSYSTDDGKSWSKDAPTGVTIIDEDGSMTQHTSTASENDSL